MSDSKKDFSGIGLVDCDELRQQLPTYMLRELGDKQSRLVHEHLRICAACRKEAALFEKMHAILQEHPPVTEPGGAVLSEKRMRRLRFTAMHPLCDWMYYQHRFVSAACAIFLVLFVLFLLRNVALFQEPDFGDRIPIWQMFRNGALPELVDEAKRTSEGLEE